MTLPSDLQRFDEWARSQGFRDRAAIAACKSFYGPALQDQLRLSRETEPVTWAEFVRVSVYAAREILGGASLLVEVYGWKLRKAQEPRELWNSLQNAFRILYPAESEKAINSLCQNQLVMAIEEVNTKEKILRFLFSAPDVSPSVLLNKVSDSLRKYRNGNDRQGGGKRERDVGTDEKGAKRFRVDAVETSKRPGSAQESPEGKRPRVESGSDFRNQSGKGGQPSTRTNATDPKPAEGQMFPSSKWLIGSQPISVRLDSGAEVTCISQKTLKNITGDIEEIPCSKEVLTSVDGSTVTTPGRKVRFLLVNPVGNLSLRCEATVIDSKTDGLWIGFDTLSENRIIMDCGSRRFRLERKWIPFPTWRKVIKW